MQKWKEFILLALLFFLAAFLRFYRLSEIPNGLYQDETAIGYNAYSIIQTGRDEYGKFMPLYFKSFGDWKLPVYIYLDTIPIKFFGLNEFAVRFPSALFGVLTVMTLYFFVKKLTEDKFLAFASSFLLAINPWHLHYSRATFEVSIALFLFLFGSLFLINSFGSRKFGSFFLGTLCFILALYSYNLTRLLSPILFILILIFFGDKIKTIKKEERILTIIVSLVLMLPFLLTFFQTAGFNSSKGTLIFSSAQVIAPLVEFKSYLIYLFPLLSKIFFNMPILQAWHYLQNTAGYLSVDFFFIQGSSHGNHGIGNVGQFYLIELPFILTAIFSILKNKIKWGFFLLLFSLMVILVASFTREVPHATRSFFLTAPFEILSAFGLIIILNQIKNIKNVNIKIIILGSLSIIILYNIIYYFTSYYVRFPILYAKAWRSEDKDLSSYIKNNESGFDKIIFDEKAGFIYSSLLFYTKYPPVLFQSVVKREEDDSEGFSKVNYFGKYEFRNIDWSKDYKEKNVMIISSVDNLPKEITPKKTFFYPLRPVVISLKQKIISYPVREQAYVLVETK